MLVKAHIDRSVTYDLTTQVGILQGVKEEKRGK